MGQRLGLNAHAVAVTVARLLEPEDGGQSTDDGVQRSEVGSQTPGSRGPDSSTQPPASKARFGMTQRDRPGSPIRPRPRHPPSRPQTGQHPHRRIRRTSDRRLRSGETPHFGLATRHGPLVTYLDRPSPRLAELPPTRAGRRSRPGNRPRVRLGARVGRGTGPLPSRRTNPRPPARNGQQDLALVSAQTCSGRDDCGDRDLAADSDGGCGRGGLAHCHRAQGRAAVASSSSGQSEPALRPRFNRPIASQVVVAWLVRVL